LIIRTNLIVECRHLDVASLKTKSVTVHSWLTWMESGIRCTDPEPSTSFVWIVLIVEVDTHIFTLTLIYKFEFVILLMPPKRILLNILVSDCMFTDNTDDEVLSIRQWQCISLTFNNSTHNTATSLDAEHGTRCTRHLDFASININIMSVITGYFAISAYVAISLHRTVST